MTRNTASAGCTARWSACGTSPHRAKRVVMVGDGTTMRRMAKRLRHRGWEVHIVGPEHDVDQAISELHPHVVVFPESQGDESGYLACAKMLQSWPFLRVIVVGAERTPQQERFARFVGGVYATVSDDLHSLLTHLNE